MDFFYFFSSLIAGTRTSKTVLNKSGENRHRCLAPDLRDKAVSFRCAVSCGLVTYMAFIMLRYVPSMQSFWRVFFFLNHKWVLNVVRGFDEVCSLYALFLESFFFKS